MNEKMGTDATLKASFEKAFPEYAARLNGASTQKEIEEIYNQIINECHQNVVKAQSEATHKSLKSDSSEGIGPFVILSDNYNDMIHATEEDVKLYVTQLFNALQLTKSYIEHNDKEAIAKQLVASGIGAITFSGVVMYCTSILKGASTF